MKKTSFQNKTELSKRHAYLFACGFHIRVTQKSVLIPQKSSVMFLFTICLFLVLVLSNTRQHSVCQTGRDTYFQNVNLPESEQQGNEPQNHQFCIIQLLVSKSTLNMKYKNINQETRHRIHVPSHCCKHSFFHFGFSGICQKDVIQG